MTLDEWTERFSHQVSTHPSGARVLPDTGNLWEDVPDKPGHVRASALRRELWSLSNWRVESVSAGSIWLSPR